MDGSYIRSTRRFHRGVYDSGVSRREGEDVMDAISLVLLLGVVVLIVMFVIYGQKGR